MPTPSTGSNWLDPAWEAAAHSWIKDRQAALGRSPTGPIERVRFRPWSAVLRAPTSAGWIWFKANIPAAAYEPALVARLAAWAPAAVVPPLAVDTARGWLLSPDGGPTLRDAIAGAREPGRWEPMLAAYGQLQRDVAAHADEMAALGAPDLRPGRMASRLDALLDDPAVRAGLGADRHATLRELAPTYARWCAELAGDGVAASVQHDDLSDANVFSDGAGFRFFDWGDASVAHPFGSLLVALYVASNRFELPPGGAELARLRDAYLEPWTAELDRSGLQRSATLAMRVAKVSRALSWRRALDGAELPVAPELSGAAVDWLAELTEPDV